ncbi:MAG: chromate transporter [Acidobacteriota bacterium]|nr:chromate transporter [Acidobacteriota bacterium]MDQ5835744.1 chromate transporter [Acidobacteriota bacterium]
MIEHADKRAERIRRSVRYGQKRLKRLSRTATLGGIFLSFLQVGFTGFGGGLAVVAQLRALALQKRRWFTEHEFAEGLALAQSLPGSMANNVAAYVGLRLRGWRGAAVAVAGLVLPSMLLMILLAILYRHLRELPDTERFFHGLNAAVVALIAVTAWRIGRSTLSKPWQWYIAVFSCLSVIIFEATVIEVVLVSGLAGIYIDSFAERRWQRWRRIRHIASLRRARLEELEARAFVGGHLTRAVADEHVRQTVGETVATEERKAERRPQRMEKVRERVRQWRRARREGEQGADGRRPGPELEGRRPELEGRRQKVEGSEQEPADELSGRESTRGGRAGTRLRSLAPVALLAAMPVMLKLGLLLTLASIFLRIGTVTFGGGFVMVPLIESEVVNARHWLTHQEFVEAFALGQITPGPVLITATFIGYRVAGTLGALVATVSIFLPSLCLTIAAGSSLRRFRANRQVQAFLRGVTPAVVGLLVAAAWSIGRAGVHTWVGVGLAVVAALVLLRYRVNPFLVMLGAAVLRFAVSFVWS